MVTAYFVLPCKYDPNPLTTATFIAMASYIGLAWYDYAYDCKNKSRPGAFISTFTAPFKPAINNGVYGG